MNYLAASSGVFSPVERSPYLCADPSALAPTALYFTLAGIGSRNRAHASRILFICRRASFEGSTRGIRAEGGERGCSDPVTGENRRLNVFTELEGF